MSINLFNINNSGTSGTTAILSAINLNTRLAWIDEKKLKAPATIPLYALPPGSNQLIGVLAYLNVHKGSADFEVFVNFINASGLPSIVPLSEISGPGVAVPQSAFFIAQGGTPVTISVQITGTGKFKYDVGAVANLVLTY